MRRRRALALKVAAPQEARLVGLQVVQPVVRQAVQPVELLVVQPGEALQGVLLAVQPVPVPQAQLEPRVLLERRVPQGRWRATPSGKYSGIRPIARRWRDGSRRIP